MLTSWNDVLKQFGVIKFSCGYSTKSSVVVGRVCELFVESMQACMRAPLESSYLNTQEKQVLLDLAKEREPWGIDPICNEFVNIISELPLRVNSQLYIVSQQLYSKVEDTRNTNETSISEGLQGCSIFIEWPKNIDNTIQFLGNLNQTVTNLHIYGLTMYICETERGIQSTNIKDGSSG